MIVFNKHSLIKREKLSQKFDLLTVIYSSVAYKYHWQCMQPTTQISLESRECFSIVSFHG